MYMQYTETQQLFIHLAELKFIYMVYILYLREAK